MGLPVWRAPSPSDSKDAIKVDLTAPARSPIRRRMRASPAYRRLQRAAENLDHHRSSGRGFQRSPRLSDDMLLSASQRFPPIYPEPDRRPTPPSQLRYPPPPVPEPRNYSNRDFARDRAYITLGGQHGDVIRRSDLTRSPLQAFGEVTRNLRDLPAFTPNFAPAAASRHSSSMQPPDEPEDLGGTSQNRRANPRDLGASSRPGSRSDNIVIIEDAEDDSSDNNAVGFPPLRRMGRRTMPDGPLPSSLRESWSPATTLDGLGDRERSFSPADDHWDPMLSNIVPDPIAPTAESSFASAAASASFSNSHPSSLSGSSNSNSASSSRTHLTVPSRRHSPDELFVRVCDTSEDDTASDTEEEDMEVRPPRERRAVLHRVSQRYNGSFLADEPPSRNPHRYSRDIRERSRDSRSFVRNYYSSPSVHQVPAPYRESPVVEEEQREDRLAAQIQEEAQSLEQDLQDARNILERLARRNDVSDDFWASVGLTRNLAERVERIQQREGL